MFFTQRLFCHQSSLFAFNFDLRTLPQSGTIALSKSSFHFQGNEEAMLNYNRKQWLLIVGSLVVAAVLNWLIWYISMGKPGNIDLFYHIVTTICLASAIIVFGDRFAKTQIFK
ncbi:MAG: hypothetical protein WAZ19_12975 [Anaerolineae bacterium]